MRIAINPFTASEDKDCGRHQVATLVERLHALPYRVCIVMVGRSEQIRQLGLDMALYIADSTINSAVEVIRSCDLVITPDTSIVHIAAGHCAQQRVGGKTLTKRAVSGPFYINFLNQLRAAGFDAVIDFDDVTSYERFKLLADLRATSVIGFNKEPYKIYDHSIAFFDGNSHISL
ncbi:hypothetical protein OQ620_26005, partial [Klebsiella pneumoniae]|nr:hypothetical protein [Klebsiella pneumoniae]